MPMQTGRLGPVARTSGKDEEGVRGELEGGGQGKDRARGRID